jgi:DNA-directed RNA polymerase II subunit RPB11
MNAPDRYELLVVPEGQKKLEIRKDTKIPNAATLIIQREDHTLGNLLRAQLLAHKSVLFAGYRVPHPLVPEIEVRVQTKKESNPAKAVGDALNTLIVDLGGLKSQFEAEVARVGGSSMRSEGNTNW